MEISKVIFNNFKPYFGLTEIDLSVNPEQNIVLIGGKNGQGKTSFLVGLVWCIYGDRISRVDDTFRKEVKGNYQKFLQSALNRRAETLGIFNYSISIKFSNVELSEVFTSGGQQTSEVTLIRTFDSKAASESFTILIDGRETGLVTDEQGKSNFVNDYLIPVEAAKFVFFDAEKISDIAEQSIKEQGRVMNDALGKILGLSKYEEAIEQLKLYISELKTRRETRTVITTQIESFRNKIKLNSQRIESIEHEDEDLDEKVKEKERSISEFERFLIRGGAKGMNIDVEKLENQKERLENDLKVLGERLKEVTEIIPFAISAGKIQELFEQISIEGEVQAKKNSVVEVRAKAEEFIDALFEQPEFPPEGDMKTLQKAFYIKKSQKLFSEVFGNKEEEPQFGFLHELPQSAIRHITSIYDSLRSGDDRFNEIFSDYIRMKNELDEIKNQLNKAKSKSEDETFVENREKLEQAKSELIRLAKKKGENESIVANAKIDSEKAKTQLDNLLDKIEVSKQEQILIDQVNRHIAALTEFIENQKTAKSVSLQTILLQELKRVMHKKDLFDEVKVEVLPDNSGLEVSLRKNGIEIPKDQLSSGEKQIYISCLLKAILQEALNEYPVFIDTPLGRLDKDHKDNFIDLYYPHLANQVILLTTDEEVTPRRKERIADKIAQTYVLVNTDNITKVHSGYF